MKFNRQTFQEMIRDGGDEAAAVMAELGYVLQAQGTEAADEEKLTAAAAEAGRKEGLAQGLTQATEIIELCNLARQPGMAAGLLKDGVNMEDARAKLQEAAAAEAADQTILSTVSALGIGEENSLIADAQKRAAAAAGQTAKEV